MGKFYDATERFGRKKSATNSSDENLGNNIDSGDAINIQRKLQEKQKKESFYYDLLDELTTEQDGNNKNSNNFRAGFLIVLVTAIEDVKNAKTVEEFLTLTSLGTNNYRTSENSYWIDAGLEFIKGYIKKSKILTVKKLKSSFADMKEQFEENFDYLLKDALDRLENSIELAKAVLFEAISLAKNLLPKKESTESVADYLKRFEEEISSLEEKEETTELKFLKKGCKYIIETIRKNPVIDDIEKLKIVINRTKNTFGLLLIFMEKNKLENPNDSLEALFSKALQRLKDISSFSKGLRDTIDLVPEVLELESKKWMPKKARQSYKNIAEILSERLKETENEYENKGAQAALLFLSSLDQQKTVGINYVYKILFSIQEKAFKKPKKPLEEIFKDELKEMAQPSHTVEKAWLRGSNLASQSSSIILIPTSPLHR